MIRSMMVCGALLAVATGCGSDDESTDTATEAEADSADEASGDLEAWCLGWNSESPPPDVQTPEDFQATIEAGLARTEALLNVAPDEIADANAAMFEAEQFFRDYLAENDWDLNSPRLDPELFEDPMNASVEQMEAFSAENC